MHSKFHPRTGNEGPHRESVAYRGGVGEVQTPPEIPKALQNRAKIYPIMKTVKNC